MYTLWHVDKYKITFKLVINSTNEILQHTVVSSGLSWPGIIDARTWYRAAARRLRNTDRSHALRAWSLIEMNFQKKNIAGTSWFYGEVSPLFYLK
jgi:hypothetical protein